MKPVRSACSVLALAAALGAGPASAAQLTVDVGASPSSPHRFFAGAALGVSVTQHLVVGGEVAAMHVGATTESWRYGCDACLVQHVHLLAFAEARTGFSGPLQLFARGGLGLGATTRATRNEADRTAMEGLVRLTVGPEVALGPVLLRPFASAALVGRKDVPVWVGLAVGARF